MLSHPQETPWTALMWGCPPAVPAVASHVSIVVVVAVVVLLL